MHCKISKVLLSVVAVVGLSGCGDRSATTAHSGSSSQIAGSGSSANNTYVAASEPEGAVPVGEARSTAKNDQQVVLVGHIGGSEKPFVDGVAAFTIVDPKVPYCAAAEGCPTPWDYCCEQNQVKDNIAMIKVVDGAGNIVAGDARNLLGVKELALVVVQGKAQRDEAGNLTLLANQVFLKK